MTKALSLIVCAIALVAGSIGCGGSKPAASDNSKSANSASNTNSAANTAAKKSEKSSLKDEKRPEGKSKTAKEVKVPDSWIYVYDENKGYGFSVPEGTVGGEESANGVDIYAAKTPEPSEVSVMVLSYKNQKLTKEDLLNDAVKVLEAGGATVTAGKLTAESDVYSLAEATAVNKEGAKAKVKILVGTDVTDNYIMIVGTEESKFAANEGIIDEIWGSFEIWSGGAVSQSEEK